MALGMTYEDYWYGDPLMVRAFYKADKLRQQRMNDEAWLYGAYVWRALDATVGNVFRKQGTKPSEYPQKPIELQEQPREEQEDETYALAYMTNMVAAGANWKK